MDSDRSGGVPEGWDGEADLFDGKEAKSRPTRVYIGPDGLDILAGEAAGRYRRGDIVLLDESEDGSFFSLDIKPHPGCVLAFRDPAARQKLRAFALLRRPAFFGLSLAGRAAVLAGFLAGFSAFMYFAGMDLAVDAAVKVIPYSADRMLGNAVIGSFSEKAVAPDDSVLKSALEKSRAMVQGLAEHSRDSIRIILVADTSIKNAFAFPGGHIVVFTGMLRLLETREEWMGLLAHEGGHIHLRHGMRRLVRASILAVGASMILGDVSGVASVLADNAGALVNLGYGRRDESEADGFARRSKSAGVGSASGLATLLEKLLKLDQTPGWAAFLSSHPATQERIRALRKGGGDSEEPIPGKPRSREAWLSDSEWAALQRL